MLLMVEKSCEPVELGNEYPTIYGPCFIPPFSGDRPLLQMAKKHYDLRIYSSNLRNHANIIHRKMYMIRMYNICILYIYVYCIYIYIIYSIDVPLLHQQFCLAHRCKSMYLFAHPPYKNSRLHNQYLGGGFKYFLFSPLFGKGSRIANEIGRSRAPVQ